MNMRHIYLYLIVLITSCGNPPLGNEENKTKAIAEGFIIQGAGTVWELATEGTNLPTPIMFSMFPEDKTLTEGKWFNSCETFVDYTLLGFKSFEADLCISGYTQINTIIYDEFDNPLVIHDGYYLRDIRVKLNVKKLDPVWKITGQGAFGDVYIKQLNPIVPAVDIYVDFNLDSLLGLHNTFSRHYNLDGKGNFKSIQ